MGPTCGEVLDGSSRVVGANTDAGLRPGDEAARGSMLYMVHGQCASVTISGPPSLAAWDDVALSVLTPMTIKGGDVTIVLPVSTGRERTGISSSSRPWSAGVRSDDTLLGSAGNDTRPGDGGHRIRRVGR